MLLRCYVLQVFAFCFCENNFLKALKSADLKYLPMDANLINDEKLFLYVDNVLWLYAICVERHIIHIYIDDIIYFELYILVMIIFSMRSKPVYIQN